MAACLPGSVIVCVPKASIDFAALINIPALRQFHWLNAK